VALRNRLIAAFCDPLWFGVFFAALGPTNIGNQDLVAFLAHRPQIAERGHDHFIASPFGTIHAATFTFSRPIGTETPESIGAEPVNFDPRSLDVKIWSGNGSQLLRPTLQVEYPTVNRRLKGDRMPVPQSSPTSSGTESVPPLQPVDAPATQPAPSSPPTTGPRPKSVEQNDRALVGLEAPVEAFGTLPTDDARGDDVTGSITPDAAAPNPVASNPAAPNPGAANLVTPLSALPSTHEADADDDVALADKPPEIPTPGESDQLDAARSPFSSLSFVEEDPAERKTQLYFSGGVMGARVGLESWPLGAEPVLVSRPSDPDIKLSALESPPDAGPGGETVAGKDDAGRVTSPAERLGLDGKPRAKAEKCLADAVYFEARGEPLRGQMAVAQVVMNRVFSGYYPNDVCGVVYQNANRHLACQFTFACEGKDLSRIDELDMWEQAKHIAKDMLDGKIWLTEVGHATHYHAYWVHPSWVHEMNKMYRLGVHTFYRPRAWGDGSDAPSWGTPAQTAEISAELADAAKSSAEISPNTVRR
jgi:hypothetical protein